MVERMPMLDRRDQPEVAIITAFYCEKLAVDAMIEDKKTYVRYKSEGTISVCYPPYLMGLRRSVFRKQLLDM